jgi:hypothetical protein
MLASVRTMDFSDEDFNTAFCDVALGDEFNNRLDMDTFETFVNTHFTADAGTPAFYGFLVRVVRDIYRSPTPDYPEFDEVIEQCRKYHDA